MTDAEITARRKIDHVRINLDEDVSSRLSTGLERFRLTHSCLPEIDLSEVSTAVEFLGRHCAAPILISSMTGGAGELARLNQRLAAAAQARGVPMGVGSQRAALEAEALGSSFRVRDLAPDIPLYANLGAVQLNYGHGVEACRRAVDMLEADALILHLNPLQEALQPEGDTRWSGLLARIEVVARALPVPVIAKEVGWGISGDLARRLVDAGVRAIDVAGAGGTSWSEVEKHRAATPEQRALAGLFVGWGIPTADSLRAVREQVPGVPLIASGGLRDGLDVAKCVGLGASLCGLAGPFLRAAAESTDAVVASIDALVATLRVAMFATGSRDLAALGRPGVLVEVP
jgi:isopentenyl-diphosphate Delta-isomerase